MNDLWTLLLDSFWPMVVAGITGTIPLSLASFAIGLVIALLMALLRLSPNVVLSGFARFYISIIRGTPLLVQLFVIFYGLPAVGVVIDPFPAAVIAFSLNVGGYAAEVIRAAILSVPRGQWEAAHTVGLSPAKTLTRIILPQAARVSVPPLSNTFISLVKDSSLASLTAALFAPVYYVFGDGVAWYMGTEILLAISVMSLLLIYRHAENIGRLAKGTESRLGKKSR